jgi:HPt (histidine-containing phosphotransfer) domain-containing protein
MTESATIDPAALDRLREWGGEKLLREMLRLFLDNSPVRMEQIRAGVASGTAREVEQGAHSLKSSAANLGARALRDVCAEMEERAHAEDVEGVEELAPRLEDVYASARARLEAIQGESAP